MKNLNFKEAFFQDNPIKSETLHHLCRIYIMGECISVVKTTTEFKMGTSNAVVQDPCGGVDTGEKINALISSF